MNDSNQLPSAEDGLKNLEENPERTETMPEMDESAEVLKRHNGKVSTTAGGASVSELMENL